MQHVCVWAPCSGASGSLVAAGTATGAGCMATCWRASRVERHKPVHREQQPGAWALLCSGPRAACTVAGAVSVCCTVLTVTPSSSGRVVVRMNSCMQCMQLLSGVFTMLSESEGVGV